MIIHYDYMTMLIILWLLCYICIHYIYNIFHIPSSGSWWVDVWVIPGSGESAHHLSSARDGAEVQGWATPGDHQWKNMFHHGDLRSPMVLEYPKMFINCWSSGWWFGCHVLFSQKYWVAIIIPIDVHIFQRGGPTSNQWLTVKIQTTIYI